MAAEALEERTPNIPEIKRDLAALEAAKAPAVRIAWIKARLAQLTNDTPRSRRPWPRPGP